MEYVAFLRGINVGGRKPVKMADLRTSFEAMGFQNVRTVLASGNVIFGAARPASPGEAAAPLLDSGPQNADAIAAWIEQGLRQAFGFQVPVVVRAMEDLRRLVDSDPFKKVARTPDTKLYVSFLSAPVENGPDFAYESPDGDLTVHRISVGEVVGMVVLSPKHGTTGLMAILDEEFGTAITTRSWDTIAKVLKA
jgi:uncharacterized protein (DUF1697 family)